MRNFEFFGKRITLYTISDWSPKKKWFMAFHGLVTLLSIYALLVVFGVMTPFWSGM